MLLNPGILETILPKKKEQLFENHKFIKDEIITV